MFETPRAIIKQTASATGAGVRIVRDWDRAATKKKVKKFGETLALSGEFYKAAAFTTVTLLPTIALAKAEAGSGFVRCLATAGSIWSLWNLGRVLRSAYKTATATAPAEALHPRAWVTPVTKTPQGDYVDIAQARAVHRPDHVIDNASNDTADNTEVPTTERGRIIQFPDKLDK